MTAGRQAAKRATDGSRYEPGSDEGAAKCRAAMVITPADRADDQYSDDESEPRNVALRRHPVEFDEYRRFRVLVAAQVLRQPLQVTRADHRQHFACFAAVAELTQFRRHVA